MTKITDAKIIGLCSKCRKKENEILRYKDGNVIEDKWILCINCSCLLEEVKE